MTASGLTTSRLNHNSGRDASLETEEKIDCVKTTFYKNYIKNQVFSCPKMEEANMINTFARA